MLATIRSLVYYLLDSVWLPLFKIGRRSIKHDVAVVKLDHIGDFFLAIDSIYSIYKRERRCVLVCSQDIARVTECFDFIDDIFTIDVVKYSSSILYRLQINHQLRKFELNKVFHMSFSRVFLIGDSVSRFLNCKNKIAFAGNDSNQNNIQKKISSRWYQRVISIDGNIFEGFLNNEFYKNVYGGSVTALDIGSLKNAYVSPSLHEDYIVINLGSSAINKRWSVENFANLGGKICQKYGYKIVLTGSKHEKKLALQFIDIFTDRWQIVDMCGKTSVAEYIGLISNARFVITNDTSAAHIAPFFNVLCFVVYGGWHFGRFLPYGDDFRKMPPIAIYKKMDCFGCDISCYAKEEGLLNGFPCISSLSVEEVLNVINSALVSNNEGSVLNRVGSPPSCGHPLITRYSGGLEWGPG